MGARMIKTVVCTAALALWAGAACAHQMRAAISTVLFNPRSGNIEVMHRFYSHDAEHALQLLTGGPADLTAEPRDRLKFAVYVHEQFTLAGRGADLEPLTLVGAELDGDYLWVYQRTPAQADLRGLTVRFDALRDIWSDHVNTLNVERGGQVRTLIFAAGAGELSVEF
ncbi:MAG: DUF6702 family protein [Gammaproteobacteria bacterium]|nr:DUF6702 family protein [Gammaproteobacteria bacterium]